MRERWFCSIVVSVWALVLCPASVKLAAQPAQIGRPPGGPAYSRVDIEAGARLYAAACIECHGRNGDQVGTVNLRTGQFRRASSDQDLSGVIANGIPAAGMPPHGFTQPE